MRLKYLITAITARISYIVLAVFAVLFQIVQPSLLSNIFLFCAGCYILFYEIFAQLVRRNMKKVLDNTVSMLNLTSLKRLENFPIPILVCGKNRNVLWFSDSFCTAFGEEFVADLHNLDDVGRDLLNSSIADVTVEGKTFKVYNDCCNINNTDLFVVYFFDTSEFVELKKDFENARPVIAYLIIDNYDELFRNIKESDRSASLAKIDDVISRWAQESCGILRKTDPNKYILFFENRYMDTFRSSKFSVLDSIRDLDLSTNLFPTLSIGIGLERDSLAQTEQAARDAVDMALSRGGDQVAINRLDGFEFFGGHAKLNDSRAKIKSRVIANQFEELLNEVDSVIVMGHRFSDMDSLGACAGICALARSKKKNAYIIVNDELSPAEAMLSKLKAAKEYENVFITKEDALVVSGLKTLVVVVDTHRASFSEMPELLELSSKTVVIDHHRKSADYIQNAALFFHEPYASSTCEMVTEIIEYIEDCRITSTEADCILAGIYLDTKNFTVKTGTCTFDASSYLRSKGANTSNVKLMFQTDMDTYKLKADIVHNTEMYQNVFAISVCDQSSDGNIQIASSQAADEMLSIENVRAAFTIFSTKNGGVSISARSFGIVNVQLIMEELGGGGHQTMAGVQLPDISVSDAYEKLTEAIDIYIEEQRVPKVTP